MFKKRVYGPVPSRRFGLSLGVDVVKFKACSYDCIYCQLGRTTDLIAQRAEFYSPQEVLNDVEDALRNGPRPDVITFAGSGEPTLYSGLGNVIDGIKSMTDIPLILLTNGSLLGETELARIVAKCDIVAPSLDAGDAETFQKVNRPVSGMDFDTMVNGLISFRKIFKGQYRLEVFLAAGITDNANALKKIAGIIKKIQPDTIDINTAVRPVPGGMELKVSDHILVEAQEIFGPKSSVIASFRREGGSAFEDSRISTQDVMESLLRRPQTLLDLADALQAHPQEVLKHLALLKTEGRIQSRQAGKDTFWSAHEG